MKIEEANQHDVLRLIELAGWMYEESPRHRKTEMDAERVYNFLSYLIGSPTGIVMVARDDEHGIVGGFVGGVEQQWYSVDSYLYELTFFIHPDFRKGRLAIKLMRAAFAKGKELGAVECVMANSTNVQSERVEALYQYVGMTRIGGVHVMDL